MTTHINNRKDERKFFVLRHIVHEYVSTASPVSSKIVAKRMGGDISSATIRNIMGELEESGYIAQPHTSAGRIPTHAGYRNYVNKAKDRIRFEEKQAQRLAAEYSRRIRSMKEIIERTSLLISQELHNAGIVMWPSIEDSYLKRIELIKLRAETVLAVLVTMTNAVKNFIIKLDKDVEAAELERAANFVNYNCEYLTFSGVSAELKRMLRGNDDGQRKEMLDTIKTALEVIDAVIEENIENEIYWEGLNYFLERSEFQDLGMTKRILQIFSERKDLVNLMRSELPHRGLRIYIGKENNSEMLSECSVITCGYELNGKTLGRIGVIGPTRMDYDNALRTVSCLSDLVSAKLEEING